MLNIIRAALFALVFLFAGTTFANSSSVENKNDQATKTANKSKRDQRGTEASPPIVKAIPAERTDAQTQQEEMDKQEHAVNERWTMVATVVLAVVTAFLSMFTFKLWRDTGRLVKGSEDTAKKELRAYICLENLVYRRGSSGSIFLQIKNFGNTPARHVYLSVWEVTDEPIAKPALPRTVRPKYIGIMAPGKIYTADYPKQNAGTSNESVWIAGRIDYEDIFANWWTLSFCFQCLTLGGNILDSMYEQWNDEEDHGKKRPPEITGLSPLIPRQAS